MSRYNIDARVTSVRRVAEQILALRFHAPELAAVLQPGQFINIRVSELFDPLLRRPYSISDIHGDECEILFAVVGKGTSLLSRAREGDRIGVLGPLGNSFGIDKPFDTAVIVAGGIGVAPFPLLTRRLSGAGKRVISFIGARHAGLLVREGLENLHEATDDGSAGFHGTVVDCMSACLDAEALDSPRIFACGPNIMLDAVKNYAGTSGIPCELSLESEMACGVGICQGCPVERTHGERKYALVCTDGPCFEAGDIMFSPRES